MTNTKSERRAEAGNRGGWQDQGAPETQEWREWASSYVGGRFMGVYVTILLFNLHMCSFMYTKHYIILKLEERG